MKGRDLLCFVVLVLLFGGLFMWLETRPGWPIRLTVGDILLLAGIFTIIAVVRDAAERD